MEKCETGKKKKARREEAKERSEERGRGKKIGNKIGNVKYREENEIRTRK